MSSCSRCALALVLLAAPAWSQKITKLLESHDKIGTSRVVSFWNPIVNDDGDWGAHVILSPSAAAIVVNGAAVLYEGDPLTAPPGRVLRLLSLTGATGGLASHARLDGLQSPLPPSPFAILRNRVPVLIQGVAIAATGLPPGTICRELGSLGSNGGNTLVSCVRTDLGQALVRFGFGPQGPATSATVDLATGQTLSDGSRVSAILTTDLSMAAPVNGRGDWMWWVMGDDGRERLVTRDRILVRSGDPSPVPGRTYAVAHPNPPIPLGHAFNDFGDYAFLQRLSGDPASDTLLVKNGDKLAQEGDVLPGLAPEVLTDLEPTSICMSNSGHVYWIARTNGPSYHNLNLMRDLEPILRVGEARVGSDLVTSLDAFSVRISPSGRYVVLRVIHGAVKNILVHIDLGASVPLESCRQNPGTLSHDAGLVLPGQTMRFTLDATAAVFSTVRLCGSLREATPGVACGIPIPFGELLIDPVYRQPATFLGYWNNTPMSVAILLPPDPVLVDLEYFLQGAFTLGNRVVLTNALKLAIGAP